MSLGRAIKAGAAYVELTVNNSKLVKGLAAAQERLRNFGAGLRTIGGTLAGFGAAGAAGLVPTIKAASDLEETMNKFNVVFGDNAGTVKQWSDQFAKQVGRSKRQISEFMAGTQDLLVPMGLEPGAATEMSKQLTALAVDLASFNNTDDADALRDLQSGLLGESEPMKKYGVIVNEAATKQELLNMSLDPKRATDQQKAIARLNVIMRSTKAAQGDAERSAGSFANQQKALKAELENTAASIGSALLPVITPLVGQLAEVARRVAEWAQQNPELLQTILKIVGVVVMAGAAMYVLGLAASALGAIFGILSGTITVMAGLFGVLLSPIGLVTLAVAGVTAALLHFSGMGSKVLDWLKKKFGVFGEEALEVLGGVRDALASGDFELAAKILWSGLKLAWTRGVAFLRQKWASFKRAFLSIATEAWYGGLIVFNNVVAGIESGWASMVATMSTAWQRFSNWVATNWNKISGAIQKAWAKVKATVKGTSADAEIRRIERQTQTANRILTEDMNRAINEAETKRKQRQDKIEKDRQKFNQGQVAKADAALAKQKAAEDAAIKAAEGDVAAARAELDAALSKVKKKQGGGDDDDGPDGPDEFDWKKFQGDRDAGGQVAQQAVQANTGAVLGTDEGTKAVLEALRFSGRDPAEDTAANTKATKEEIEKMRKLQAKQYAYLKGSPILKVEKA